MSSTAINVEAWFAPDGIDRFISHHLERAVWIGRSPDPTRFEPLLTWRDLDAVLNTGLRYPDVLALRDGYAAPKEKYCRGARSISASFPDVIDTDRVLELWRDGYTLKLDTPERFWPPLRQLCTQLTATFGFGFETNVYMTPNAARGLARHYDEQDVFVLQIDGRKEWWLFEPAVMLPDPLWPGHSLAVDKVGEPIHQIRLAPGDVLYVPRGFVHEAQAQREPSVHLTIARRAVMMVDWALAAVNELRAHVDLRRSVSGRALLQGMVEREVRDEFIAHLTRLLDPDVFDTAFRRLSQQVVDQAAPDRPGGTRAASVPPLTGESTVVRPAGVVASLQQTNARLTLRHRGHTHSFPATVRQILERLLSGEPVRIDSLTGIAPEARLALVRHLVAAGIIEAQV